MTVDYSKDLDQIDDIDHNGVSKRSFSHESLNGKIISGIPSQDTLNNIVGKTSVSTFKIERKIRPKVEVSLTR